MGLAKALRGRPTYLDANVLIYAVDGIPPFDAPLRELMAHVDAGILSVSTSELSLAEVLVRPFREHSTTDIERYERLLESRPFFAVERITREILIYAAQIRASTRQKLPDAIHFATAVLSGCTVFLTNDVRIHSSPELEVLNLSDLLRS